MFPFQVSLNVTNPDDQWKLAYIITPKYCLGIKLIFALVPKWHSRFLLSFFSARALNLALGNPVTWRHQFEGKSMPGWGGTPWTINMEPKNGGLEDDLPFQTGDFQVNQPLIAGGVCSLFIVSGILEVYITESLESLVCWISDVQLWVCSEEPVMMFVHQVFFPQSWGDVPWEGQ